MKKHQKIISLITLILLLVCSLTASANGGIKVFLNNEQLQFDVEPIIQNSRTLVPMRAISEKLGAEVTWDSELNVAHIHKKNTNTVVTFPVGAPYMLYNFARVIETDTPTIIKDGRTLIPLRALSEAFGCDVEWDSETSTVAIFSEDFIDFSKETDTQTVVEASTAQELLQNIGSNKKIILTADYYNISAVESVDNPSLTLQDYTAEFKITDVVNLTIEGNAEIVIDNINADVLSFENCGDITLSGLTVGHTSSYDEYMCEGAVTRFDDCLNVTLKNCNLYGCGAFGIYADNTKNLLAENCKIYDCTYTGIWLTANSEANVTDTEFFDSNHTSGFIRVDSSVINCTDCNIHDIVCSEFSPFIDEFSSDNNPSVITFTNCSFENNTGSLEHRTAVFNN